MNKISHQLLCSLSARVHTICSVQAQINPKAIRLWDKVIYCCQTLFNQWWKLKSWLKVQSFWRELEWGQTKHNISQTFNCVAEVHKVCCNLLECLVIMSFVPTCVWTTLTVECRSVRVGINSIRLTILPLEGHKVTAPCRVKYLMTESPTVKIYVLQQWHSRGQRDQGQQRVKISQRSRTSTAALWWWSTPPCPCCTKICALILNLIFMGFGLLFGHNMQFEITLWTLDWKLEMNILLYFIENSHDPLIKKMTGRFLSWK